MTKNTPEPLFVIFYQMTPDGEVNIEDLRDLDIRLAGALPSVGDYVHHIMGSQNFGIYRVKEKHFDPTGQRVAVLVERTERVPNSPFD